MSWFSRNKVTRDAELELESVKVSLAQALESGFAKLLEAQAKMVETNGHFLNEMSQIQVRKAAQALGTRGGRKKAVNAQARKLISGCALCQDPMRQDVTVEMIARHREHGLSTGPTPNGPVQ
jgi:hypothetical protein